MGFLIKESKTQTRSADQAIIDIIALDINAIKISASKVLSPSTVTFTGYAKTGTANTVTYSGRFNVMTSTDGIVYSSVYVSTANQSTYTYTIPTTAKFIDGEGLLFPKSGTIIPEDGKIDRNGTWDTFRVMDGVGYLNSKPVFFENADILWSGQAYPVANSGITPRTALNDCPNGWILVWSDYDSDTGKANDSDWHFTFIPKSHRSGGGIRLMIPNTNGDYGDKYIYCNGTQINGHADNSLSGASKDVVLRQVVAF